MSDVAGAPFGAPSPQTEDEEERATGTAERADTETNGTADQTTGTPAAA